MNILKMLSNILNNFQELRGLEYMCANESLSGNYHTDADREWYLRFSRIWEKAEERESSKFS